MDRLRQPFQKITVGFVTQNYNGAGEPISQEFYAGDEVTYEDGLGDPILECDVSDGHYEEYLPFNMVQPVSSDQMVSNELNRQASESRLQDEMAEDIYQMLGKQRFADWYSGEDGEFEKYIQGGGGEDHISKEDILLDIKAMFINGKRTKPIKPAPKAINSINVIELQSGVTTSLSSYNCPDMAEKRFCEILTEQGVSEDDFNDCITDGNFDDNYGFSVQLVHSTNPTE